MTDIGKRERSDWPMMRLASLPIELLKSFYHTYFDLPVAEEIENEWVVLKAGEVEIALHRVGEPYRDKPQQASTSNAKIVFSVSSGLPELRERLVSAGVRMRNLKLRPVNV